MLPESASIAPRCPIRTALDLLGGKWRLILLRALSAGPARFAALRRAVPAISEKVLTAELRHLTDAGLVERVAESDGGVSYKRLPLADLADPVIECLAHFGAAYSAARVGGPENASSATSSQGPPR